MDQSIHNHLYYSGQLPFATAFPNRGGGIVNTAGYEGAILSARHRENMIIRFNQTKGEAMWNPFEGASGTRWIGPQYNIADDEGFFTDFDGSWLRVVHQWDRFKRPYVDLWVKKQSMFSDPIPIDGSPPAMGLKPDPVIIP